MPPGSPEIKPNNKISEVYFQDVKNYDGIYDFIRIEDDKEELPYIFNYTYLNKTQCRLKLTFRDDVNDPELGNPDNLFIKLASRYVFVSEKYRAPLNDTMMNFTLPF